MIRKLIINKKYVPVDFEEQNDRLKVSFEFNRQVIDEIKSMEGARWDNENKVWWIKNSQRNKFQLDYLCGNDVYAHYDKPIPNREPTRNVMSHQRDLINFALARKQCIIAAEMGTGKTLVAIEVMELSGYEDWLWVAPKSALNAAKLEFRKWNSYIRPTFLTYESFKDLIKYWPSGEDPPHGIIIDESSRVKTPTSQRSMAVKYIADEMREKWGMDAFIILMSGSPAPKSPVDWFWQCEIACPGYLKEGDVNKFKRRLALIKDTESITGGLYPKFITWLDNEKKCQFCGQIEEDEIHFLKPDNIAIHHQYIPSKNEVSYLYRRMKGLVEVKFKKDCLDLPDKIYRTIKCEPSESTLRIAELIKRTSPNTITALTLLRELSDGFQYDEIESGIRACSYCNGSGQIEEYIEGAWFNDITGTYVDAEGNPLIDKKKAVECHSCEGKGIEPGSKRILVETDCPKDKVLVDLLDEYSEIGRIVIYAGFTGSLDRIERICNLNKWNVIRVDGKGWKSSFPLNPVELLELFQSNDERRIAFIGHPKSGGMGITLTASPVIVYYSNDFDFEGRVQSEDRIHRIGLDCNLGATIIDILHLPTDELVLNNLKRKRVLQTLTLGDMEEAMKLERGI